MYIGHYNDGTGYGNMASNYIECLVGQGIDVVSIPLIFGPNKIEPSDIIKKTEKKKLSGIDMVIIHTLPKFYHNHPSLPTIGIFSSEMSGIPKTWVNKINQLSASIVSSKQSQLACIGSGAKSPFVLPYAFNMENYQKSYDHIKITKRLKNEGKTIFYTIGEFINRKNFSALLRAYYTEFTKQDNVHLIIKSGLSNHSPQQVGQLFERKNYEIVKGLNISSENLPEVTFSPTFLTKEQIYSLHYNSDIYIGTSFGESWDVNAFEGMAFGKTPITIDGTGYLEYNDESVGYLVKKHELPCFGLIDGDPELYNSHFNYYSVDINDLKLKMRKSLTRDKNKSIAGMEKAHLFSYDNVGKLFRKVLENVQEVQALEGSSRGIL